MGLLETIGILFGGRAKRILEGIREGETLIVQRRNGRLLIRKGETPDDHTMTSSAPKKRQLPNPEDFIFKVSSGR